MVDIAAAHVRKFSKWRPTVQSISDCFGRTDNSGNRLGKFSRLPAPLRTHRHLERYFGARRLRLVACRRRAGRSSGARRSPRVPPERNENPTSCAFVSYPDKKRGGKKIPGTTSSSHEWKRRGQKWAVACDFSLANVLQNLSIATRKLGWEGTGGGGRWGGGGGEGLSTDVGANGG